MNETSDRTQELMDKEHKEDTCSPPPPSHYFRSLATVNVNFSNVAA